MADCEAVDAAWTHCVTYDHDFADLDRFHVCLYYKIHCQLRHCHESAI